MIALGKPSIQQDKTSPTLKRRHEDDEIETEQHTLPRRPDDSSSHKNVLKPHQKTNTEAAATIVEQKDRTTNLTGAATTEEPSELSSRWQAFVEKLREEAEIVGSTLSNRSNEPIELKEGDFLELDTSQYLHPKAGSVGGMWMSYDWS